MTLEILRSLGLLPFNGRFSCDEEIGVGKSARSFFGVDQQTGTQIHVKVLISPRSLSEAARFHNEAYALQVLGQYPLGGNVPKFIANDEILNGEVLYLVTERADGKTVANWLESEWQHSSAAQRLEVFHRVAASLSPGCNLFTHRDLHPENILLLNSSPSWYSDLPDPATLILDWGQAYMPLLARFEDSPEFALILQDRIPKEIIGSFYALPPDVFYTHADALNHPGKHDSWSLGLLLHRILTGKTLLSFKSIGEYVENCRNGNLAQTLRQAAQEIKALDYTASHVLAGLFERLTFISPSPRFEPMTAARVMWDIRIEEFHPTSSAIVALYIKNPNDYEPEDGWRFSIQPDYD